MSTPSVQGAGESSDVAPRILAGKYRLEERIGEGTAGVVYRALHLGLKKRFAAKLLRAGPADSGSLARFAREAETLGRLRHPNVVEVTDFGFDAPSGSAYLVMELLEGKTLADFCREVGPLPLDVALPLLGAIAAAVDAAHAQGVLHRDLKPGNVFLVAAEGETPRVKVLDFGLAEMLEPRGRSEFHRDLPARTEGASPGSDCGFGSSGALLGTPQYLAPEVIRHQIAGRASDLYSFGVIAYEVLAGRPPFLGTVAEVLEAQLNREPVVPERSGQALPDVLWQAVLELLRKDPSLRPASADQAVAKIRRAAERAALDDWRRTERPKRLLLAAAGCAMPAVFGLFLGDSPWPALDRWMEDSRARSAPSRAPDPRILLLSFDEASLAGAPPLTDRADEIGGTLDRVVAAGARGVAIDLLLPAKWARSTAFSDFVLRNEEALTLAAFSRPDGRAVGTECLAGLTAAALGPDRLPRLFGFVNLDVYPDGVTRQSRLRYRNRQGRWTPSWAAKAAERLGIPGTPPDESVFRLDPRIDTARFSRLSWRNVSTALDRNPERFRGRLVLVGGDFDASGDDVHRVSQTSGRDGEVSGLVLQAMLVDTLVAGRPVREPNGAPFRLATVALLGLGLAPVLLARRSRLAVACLTAATAIYLAVSFPAFWWAGWQLPTSHPVLLFLAGLALALLVRRRYPQSPEVSS